VISEGQQMSTPDPTAPDTETPPNRWQRARLPLLVAGPIVAVVLAAFFYVRGGRYEKTEDAYVLTARTAISANVPGRVVELAVRDNQAVRRGDLLYRLDDAPFRIYVEEAEAQLATATLQVASLKATYLQRQSDLASAQETLAFQQSELERQKRLIASGIASQAQVDRATHALDEARARLSGVQHEITGVIAQLGGNPQIEPSKHPTVMQAQAALDRARLNLSVHHDHRAERWRRDARRTAAGGQLYRGVHTGVRAGLDPRRVARSELQGGSAWPHARGSGRECPRRQLSGQDVQGQGRECESGYRIAVLDAAGRERDR
jgi:multidrug efflux pump subunit AcrA (membrane-fusion protein)